MKLKERLEQLDPQTVVFLGSATSFFDVNRAGYMREEKYLNELSKQEKEKLKKSAVSTASTQKNLRHFAPYRGNGGNNHEV